jgi:hypothetical protein
MGQILLADAIVLGGCDDDMTGLTRRADRCRAGQFSGSYNFLEQIMERLSSGEIFAKHRKRQSPE